MQVRAGSPEGDDAVTDQPVPHHDELPLPDYDHLPVGSLEGRIRSLDADGLEALLSYERAHGDRLPVLLLLERRLDAVRGGAEPSGGPPPAGTPGGPGPPPPP